MSGVRRLLAPVALALALAACQPRDEPAAEADTVSRAPAPAPDRDVGERSYEACAACHGPMGEGSEALGTPAIAGLDSTYFIRQMRNFSTGLRGTAPGDHLGRQMHLVAVNFPAPDELDDLAAYVEAMPSAFEPREPGAADGTAGAAVFALCVACHGARAEGNAALGGPALGGQHRGYLLRQLANFRSGRRGADAADVPGSQMAAATAGLDEAQIEAVAAFLAGTGG